MKDEDDVYVWSTEKLWNYVRSAEEELEDHDLSDIELARVGVSLSYPIQYLFHEYFEEHPQSRKCTIKGYGKFSLEDFWADREAREKLLRNIVLRLLEKKNPLKPRGAM